MNSDQEITLTLSASQAASIFLSRLKERWRPFAAVWLLTGFGALVIEDFLLPPTLPWDTPSLEGLGVPLLIMVGANLFSLFGAIVVMRLFAEVEASPNAAAGAVATVASHIGVYLLTLLLSTLRILLVGLGSLPLVFLAGFFLYGAAQGTLSPLLEQTLVAAPILLFLVIGFARFGWALVFTVVHGSAPSKALRLSKALFADNRRALWILTALCVVGPVAFTLLNGVTDLSIGQITHPFRYASSLWSFLASGFAALLIANAQQKHPGPEGP